MLRFATTSGKALPILRMTHPLPMSPLITSSHYCKYCYYISSSIQHQRLFHHQQQQHEPQKYFSTASTERLRNDNKASTSPRMIANGGSRPPHGIFNWRRTNYYYQRYYERYKLWAMILGLLTIGSIIKVVYFKFSRQLRMNGILNEQLVHIQCKLKKNVSFFIQPTF